MCYNNESLLKETVESILKQVYDPIEIIISDDGSDAYNALERQELLSYCKQKVERVISNHNVENKGTVRHFNELIKKASGEYIVPLSCGDKFYDERVLENVHIGFNETNALVITGRRTVMMSAVKRISFPSKKHMRILHKSILEKLQYLYRYAGLISGACTYYKKEVFQTYGLFDEQYRLMEDTPYYINLLEKNVDVAYIDKDFIYHDTGGVSTGEIHPALKKDIYIMFKNIEKHAMLNFFSRRVVRYRIKKYEQGKKEMSFLEFAYPDVMFLLLFNQLINKYNV